MLRFLSSVIISLFLVSTSLANPPVIWSGTNAKFINSGTLWVPGLAPGGVITADSSGLFSAVTFNSLFPTQSGHSGEFLSTNGTTISWQPASGSGTVTNVTSADGSIDITNPMTTPDLSLHFPISAPNGSAGAPSYRFDSDSGMFGISDGVFGFSTNGVERCRFENNGDISCTGTLIFNGNASFTGNISAANYPPNNTANTLAWFNSSGVLDSLSQWGVDDLQTLTNITSVGSGDSRSDYWQIRAQTNLGGTITGTARSSWFNLTGGGTINSAVGFAQELSSVTTAADMDLGRFSSDSSSVVGGNFRGVSVTSDASITGDLELLSTGGTGTVGGNYRGIWLNDGSAVVGDKTLFAGSHYGSANNLTYFNVNGNGNAAGGFSGVGINNSGTIAQFSTGLGYSQSGDVTKGMLGVNIFADANIGDGSGVNLTFFNGSTSSGKTINGNLNGAAIFNQATITSNANGFLFSNNASYAGLDGFNVSNSGTMSGNNTFNGLNVNNSGTGYRFTGSTVSNSADQSEEIRGALYNLSGDSRTKTGLDIIMDGNTTDDAQGIRVNVSNQTSSSTTQHVVSGSFGGGVFGVQSQVTPFNGTAGPVEVGNNISITETVQNGSPITSADLILTLIQSNLLLHDSVSNGPIGLGTSMYGLVSQTGLDSGTSIPTLRTMLLGTSVPVGSGGTITDHVVLEILGLPSFGGSVTNTNRIGIQDSTLLGQNFCDNSTNCWWMRVRDTDAETSLPKLAINTASETVTDGTIGLEINDKHIKVTQTLAPGATVDANAGTSATCTVSEGADHMFHVELMTGSGSWASGSQCAVEFDTPYSTAPICTFSPRNSNAALAALNTYATESTTALTFNFVNPDIAATTYQWSANCVEP